MFFAPRVLLLTAIVVARSAGAPVISIGGTAVANQGQVSSVAGATTVNFNGLPLGGPQNPTFGIASYQNLFIFADPGNGDLLNDTSRASTAESNPGVTIQFSTPIVYFGLYWGSPDRANTITLYQGANAILTFTGQQLNTQFGVGLGRFNAAYVNFTAGPGESFDRITISPAGSFPFETDNHAFIPAPEPGALGLLAAGLGLLCHRKRNQRRGASR